MVMGEHHVIVAVGVDVEGHKHILGIADGASENAAVAKGLLEDLVERGVARPGPLPRGFGDWRGPCALVGSA